MGVKLLLGDIFTAGVYDYKKEALRVFGRIDKKSTKVSGQNLP